VVNGIRLVRIGIFYLLEKGTSETLALTWFVVFKYTIV